MIVFLDVIRLDTVTARVRTPSQSPANNYEGIIIMTTTGNNTRPLPLIGQAVGQAQASLTRLLTGMKTPPASCFAGGRRQKRHRPVRFTAPG